MSDREAGRARPATLPQLVADCAGRFADRDAILWRDRRWTYTDLAAESARVARGLRDLGIGPGDRVGVLLPNWPELFSVAFAIQAVGGVTVCLSTMATEAELSGYLEQATPRALVYTPAFLKHDYVARLDAVAARGCPVGTRIAVSRGGVVPSGSLDYEALGERPSDPVAAFAEIDVSRAGDPAAIFFTSGSTARPKAVVHAHRALVHQAYVVSDAFGLTSEDRSWGCLPMFFAGGFVIIALVSFARGAGLVLQDHFDAGDALDLMERHGITFYAGWQLAPALCDHETFPRRRLRLRKGIHAPSPATSGLLAPDHVTVGAYGLSETAAVICLARWDDLPELRQRGFGRPLPGVELRVVDRESGAPLSAGQVGEIRVRAPSLMLGYLGIDPRETFDGEGFFPTGDIGRIDETGTLRFDGRIKEVIKTAGVNVAAAEVEACLERCEGVRAAYVVPVPHPVRGENIAAFLVPEGGKEIDLPRLLAECRRELASYKVPRHLFVLAPEDVPRTATQKVDKPRLKRQAAESADGPSDLVPPSKG